MAVSLRASKQGLEIVDQARRKKGWLATAPAWCDAAQTSPATLKRFRGGQPIQQDVFIAICKAVGIETWEEIVDKRPIKQTAPPVLCSAYREETWVGREELIGPLSHKLRSQCRVLVITGITGLGKTALAERLATVELREDWPEYKVINFDDIGTQDFVSTAENLLIQLEEKVTVNDRKDPEGLLNRLVQKLRSRRYLVQIDSLEKLLRGWGEDDIARNEFQDERWWDFFKRLLAGQDCQSRLILTSQDLPTQFMGCKYQERWAEERLTGFNEPEQFKLFEKLFRRKERGIEPESEAAGYLKCMGKAYEGHPLGLEVIAGEILAQPFNGNVIKYCEKYGKEFETRETVIGHHELQLRVEDRVRKSLERLQKDAPVAYVLLLRSSVYRCSVPERFWLAMLGDVSKEKEAAALGTLQSRYLVLKEGVTSTNQFLLRQHNLIRSVAYKLLKRTANEGVEQKEAHHTATKMWFTAYKPGLDTSNLERVKGYLEAFHHLCEVEDWIRASAILAIRLNTPTNNELHNQLGVWGYYKEQLDLYNKLLNKLNSSWNSICYYGLGNVYYSLGDYAGAIKYHKQDLAIAQKIGDRSGEGKALGNLGIAHRCRGDYALAIKYHQQDLAIAREIGDRSGEGKALGNLGMVYNSLGDYTQGIDYHQHYLDIAQEIGDRFGEGIALCSLGETLIKVEHYPQALKYLYAALKIMTKISARSLEAEVLKNLAELHHKLGNRDLALEFCNKALAIATDLGIPLAKECQELNVKFVT